MADDIFVGSVSVGVVPDLRGFNDKLRAGLIPAADRLGRDMGKELTKGITAGLDMPKVLKDATPKAMAASKVMGREMGKELTKGVAETFDIGKIILDATRKAKPVARLAGKDLGDVYGKAFRRGLDDALKGIKAKVNVDLNKASLERLKAEVRRGVGSVDARVKVGGGAAGDIEKAVAGAGGGGGGGIIGGLSALIKALPGGTSGSIGAVPAPVLIGAGAVTAAVLPFIGQILAGVIPALGGGAIAGLGIAGAFGPGGTTQTQVAQARLASQAADARVRAAQARVSGAGAGVSGPSRLAAQAAGLRLSAAQERLQTAMGGTSASAIISAQAGVASAQDHINKLRSTGKGSTAQLASAEASLASARATQSKASQAYQKAQADQITKGQQSVRDSFKQLSNDAKTSLSQIGQPMVPVMNNILKTVDKTMKVLTPVFKGAVGIISGPFQTFSDTILNAFKDPQVKSSVIAVATAFADVMKAFTPDVKGIIDSFAEAVERVAQSVSKNPKAFADFLNFIFQVGIFVINAIAALSNIATWIEKHWGTIWESVKTTVSTALGPIAGLVTNYIIPVIVAIVKAVIWVKDNWSKIWGLIKKSTKATWDEIRRIFADFIVGGILNMLGTVLHAASVAFGWIPGIGPKLKNASAAFDQFKDDVNKSLGGINDQTVKVSVAMTAKTNPYPGGISGRKAMGGYIGQGKWGVDDQLILAQRGEVVVPTDMVNAGAIDHLRGRLPGFAAGGAVGLDVNVVKPSADVIGRATWAATVKTVSDAFKNSNVLASMFGGVGGTGGGGSGGAGVQRWAGLVLQILAMFGQPASLLNTVLRRMNQESGGNPNAINLWDSNAAAGDPSRGLMQTIGSTFARFAGPFASRGIFDPFANVYASFAYAIATYGSLSSAFNRAGGYAKGTGGAAPGWAWVGEHGPELVKFVGGETVVPAGGIGGYAGGTSGSVSAAESIAAHNKALAAQTAAHNRALIASVTAHRRATAAAIAAYNKMTTAGASLAAAVAKITPKTTASVFASDQAKFLADLRLYFTPSVAKSRSLLVIRQIKELQNLQTSMTKLSANIANAIAFQKQTYGQLRTATGIGTIGIQGVGAAGGRSILTGLQQRLSATRSFGLAIRDLARAGASQAVLKQVAGMDPASGSVYARKMISALNKMHSMKLSPEMITQLVALGPDAALAYVNAIQAGGPSLLKQVKSTEAALEAARIGTSRGIASVVAGGAYVTGANFLAGLKSQEKGLEKQFAHLGRVLGEEAIKWMHVPAKKRPYGYASGGWINEPVSGVGQYTGAFYTFAETGREYVLPEGQVGARGGDGDSYHAHFDGLTGAAIESHVRTAFKAMSMQQGALNRAGRRSL